MLAGRDFGMCRMLMQSKTQLVEKKSWQLCSHSGKLENRLCGSAKSGCHRTVRLQKVANPKQVASTRVDINFGQGRWK